MLLRRVIEHVRTQNWTAVGIDFCIVVVGILLALEISEWNEARQDRARERAYLGRIAAELSQSITDIEECIEIARQREDLGRLLMDAALDEAPVREDPGRFILALRIGAYTFSPAIRSHAFDELRSVGELDLIRDTALLVEITEFHTNVREVAQWNYLRELFQTEYEKRGAGILTHAQLVEVDVSGRKPTIAVADALAARARMLERPDFIEWLPKVAHRFDEIKRYNDWLAPARTLHDRIVAHLQEGERE
jgi:hypothetical protein